MDLSFLSGKPFAYPLKLCQLIPEYSSRTSITLAVFAFVGVEIVVVTTIEAEAPVRDLPRASRRVCIWTSLLYVVTILIVSLNVSSVDTGLQPLLGSTGFSPFIIAIKNAKLSHGSKMIKAVNAGLILAAWTTA